jgi:D-lactate dehydrogenase
MNNKIQSGGFVKVLFFSSDDYVQDFFIFANKQFQYNLDFCKLRLSKDTASIAAGYAIISCSIYDELDAVVLKILNNIGVKLVALRSAGYNNVDVKAAAELNIIIAYVPTYSPYSVAEHAVALILSLNRKIHKAYSRVRDGNFSLRSLLGFDLHDANVGIIGTGRIGTAFAHIMHGFGCKILCYDKIINKECLSLGAEYVLLNELFSHSEIISLHCPLVPETYHIIDSKALNLMRNNVMIINTSRGGLIDTKSAIKALKSGKIGYLGLDVYEAEKNLFFNDLSERIVSDDVFSRLLTFPNVLITSHQGFLTKQAYTDIANITLQNIMVFITGDGQLHKVPNLTSQLIRAIK